jgi:peptidoglycan/xylan/chitin deacetylase (PgdA/CDA1 family)
MKLRGISNKREFLARLFGQLGAVNLLERFVAVNRPALVVLTYHRIAERGADKFYDPVISASPQSFRAQVMWLKKRMRILTLIELDDRIRAGGSWNEPTALVTFDDGYRDNFDVAAPILKELDIPATFFIPTEFLESPKLPWWDHVAFVIKQTSGRRLLLKRNPRDEMSPIDVKLDSKSREAAVMTIIRAILDETIADLPWFLEHLTLQAEVTVEAKSLGRDLFMSWDQVRQLADTGGCLTVGSHSHSHHDLTKLDAPSQQRELVFSKQLLEKRLGREITAIAYPFGWPGTYTHATRTLAGEAGYRLAFTSRIGVNHPGTLDPLEMNRLGVGSGDSSAMLRARTALYSAFGRSFL